MFIKRQISTLLLLIPALFVGCGRQTTSSLQTFWALNQNDDIIIAKGIHQDAITIFKCPTAKNPNLLGDAVDLGALDSCADKVMIYESLSYQALKDILLGISPFLIHEMTDATQAELFSQYFNEREGVYERVWLEKKRNELKQSADTMNALIVRKKAIGIKVSPVDESKLEKIRFDLHEFERSLEELDSVEKQVDLLVHEFWDLIQEQSVFQTRFVSLGENIIFLGLDESKKPKHNLFNLWFRDISASSDDLTLSEILAETNRTTENGARVKRDGQEFGSEFVKSFGDKVLLFDWRTRENVEKTDALLTTVTIDESDGSLSYVSRAFGAECSQIDFYKVYNDVFMFKCQDFESKRQDFLIVEIVDVYPLSFEVYRLKGLLSKDEYKTKLAAARSEGEWIFFMSNEESMEVLITNLDRIKTNSLPIWNGTLTVGENSENYILGLQKINKPTRGFAYSVTAKQSYFIPWPITSGIESEDLFKNLNIVLRSRFNEEKFTLAQSGRAGQSTWAIYPKDRANPELPVVNFITGLRERADLPGQFTIEASEYTVAKKDLDSRLNKKLYWRGHLVDRTFKVRTMSKITKPYFY